MTLRTAVFQIYYDEDTRRLIEPGFIGLDNTSSPDPGWFEFGPMLRYLDTECLKDDVWYGFVSPKFRHKAHCDAAQLHRFLAGLRPEVEVALFSPGWDQLCYFQNPWEQGEVWHPGLSAAMQGFLASIHAPHSVSDLVTDVSSSVFSNYIVAKKRFWLAWQRLARALRDFIDAHPQWQQQRVPYGQLHHQQPLKAFLQERLASYLLTTQHFEVAVCPRAHHAPIFRRLFPKGEEERRLLGLCDHFKRAYRQSGAAPWMQAYAQTRRLIGLARPYPPDQLTQKY